MFEGPLQALDDRGGTHAGCDAQRGEARAFAGTLKLIQKRADDDGPGGAQRVAHGDGAAIDVDFGAVDIKGLHEAQNHGGEGFVDLEQVDVIDRHAAVFEDPFGDRHVDLGH